MAENPFPRLRSQDAAVRPQDRADDRADANIEQTYVLEGSLVDKEGPAQGIECKAGEFIWREEGSRHVAWCPEGGLMLAIFQVPNKFFEADGRVIDAAGEDWDAAWGHTRKG
jgi:quercetin dioxygenase-like cupin family protein